MQVLAPAKLNLSLRILHRRPDGFHQIETFIVPISLCDTIELQRQPRWIDLQCDDPSLLLGDENLVMRAAKAFFALTKERGGVSIRLHKAIPHGAGLGGGSSDAGSTLLALNELFETNIPLATLAKIAETLGSDVPFFLFKSAALCRGRGELVTPQLLTSKLSILLLKPDFCVTTAWAYKHWQHSRQLPGVNYSEQTFRRHSLVNDLERSVFEKFLFLAEMKSWLLEQPEVGAALMSGSGSTVFALVKDGANCSLLAERARHHLDPKLWTYPCETLSRGSTTAGV